MYSGKHLANARTLFCDLDLPASEVGLLDVLDAEVAVALGVLLLLVPRGGLIVRAVRVRRRCNTQNTHTHTHTRR